MIQPIVMVNSALGNTSTSTSKQSEKEGKRSSGFDSLLLLLTVETEKGKEVNVETSGLLTQMMVMPAVFQTQLVTNTPAELTENIENPLSPIKNFSLAVKEPKGQHNQLPIIAKGELSEVQLNGLIKSNPLSPIGTSVISDKVVHTEENHFLTDLTQIQQDTESKQGYRTEVFQVQEAKLAEPDVSVQLGSLKLKSDLSQVEATNSQFGVTAKMSSAPLLETIEGSNDVKDSQVSHSTIIDPSLVQKSNLKMPNTFESALSMDLSNEQATPISNLASSPPFLEGLQENTQEILLRNESSTNVQPITQDAEPKLESLFPFERLQDVISNAKIRENDLPVIPQQADLKVNKSIDSTVPMEVSQEKFLNGETNEVAKIPSPKPFDHGNDSEQLVLPEAFQTVDKSTDNHSLMNSALSQSEISNLDSTSSVEKHAVPNILRAEHFDQEIDRFVKSVFQVKDLRDGIEATFRLSPEHMGKVDVKVSIVDGNVTAEFLASTPVGKDLLETHVQTLRLALETQGLQVDKINVSQQSASTYLGSFSQKGESNGRHSHQDAKKRNVQIVNNNQENEYQEYGLDSGTKINTTA